MRSKIIGYSTFLALAVVVAFGMMLTQQASAATFGVTGPNVGYYDQQTHDPNYSRFFYTDGIPSNWQANPMGTTADSFIASTRNYLFVRDSPYNNGPNAAIWQQEYADARASFMINAMMGVESNDARYNANPGLERWQNGVILAKQLFNQWEATVRAYDRRDPLYGGAVNFNDTMTAPANDFTGTGEFSATVPTIPPRGTAHGDNPDVAYAPTGQMEFDNVIVFTHRDTTTQFIIKKMSGYIAGVSTPFPQTWLHRPNMSATTPPSPVSGSSSTVLNFTGSVTNTGTMPSGGGVMTGMVQQDSLPPQALSTQNFGPLNPTLSTANMNFSFTVPPFSPAGTTYCVFVRVNPERSQGSSADTSGACYSVGYASYPSIQGVNGDIQAGGGICGGVLSSGNIKGSSSGMSVGDYVVAASGQVNDFGSSGSSTNRNLVMGANGGYPRACRPNLLRAAVEGRQVGAAEINVDTVNLSDITGPGRPEVYYYDGNELTISGMINSKVTIVATIGSVKIGGQVLMQTNTVQPARSVTSLGIIAERNITIDPTVTRVDAYMFSNETIDTCNPGATNGSTCATPPLVVNGFLMGKSLLFNRIGRLNTGGPQISERIVLMPHIYLNPPKFFEESTKEVLQTQGEKTPLF